MSPWSVLTPGFQMSFAATGALIATYEAWRRRRRATGETAKGVGFWVKSLVVTSLVTSLATIPFALYHFDRFAGLGLIANVIAMPIISLATAPLAGAALVLAPFGLSEFALRLFGQTLEGVLWVAHTFSDMSPERASPGKAMPGHVLLIFSVALTLSMVLIGWRRRVVAAGIVTAAGIGLWISSPAAAIHWAPSGEVFTVDATGKLERIELVNGDGLAPLRFIDEPVSAQCKGEICWREVAGVQLALIPEGVAASCAQVGQADMIFVITDNVLARSCGLPVIEWSRVQAANGLSWRLEEGVYMLDVHRPPCGERPWNPCAGN